MRLYIGFIAYGESTAKYLPYFLPSLRNQTFKDFKILAVDNSEEEKNGNSAYIKNNFPEIELTWAGKNLGFAKAFNLMIKEAVEAGAEYFLALNPDMVLEPEAAGKMLEVMESDEKIGAVAPKILYWDFIKNKKTGIIDSYGIFITPEHRFSDCHQGEQDKKDLIASEEVFGFTGAAVMLRLKALRDVAYDNGNYPEYFDELMFMYKEDCDLSYRLRLAGWKIIFSPNAVAYHHRSIAPVGESNWQIILNRAKKNKQVKKWAYLNHWILLVKYKNLPISWRVKSATWWYQIKSLVFVLLLEQYLLKEFIKLWSLSSEIKKRREQLKIRVGINEIEKYM
ncbi:MAG: glycosyltransferase family 2 protein [Patescibacteria group bacterium]|jgi:GT2 family glycosyltransferase